MGLRASRPPGGKVPTPASTQNGVLLAGQRLATVRGTSG
jgi:hypothetical protein